MLINKFLILFHHNQLQENMRSNFVKKIIGIERQIQPFTYRDKTGVSRLIIYKGYEPHYQWLSQNHQGIDEKTIIYSYDKCSVDLALEMALRNTTKLSYISTRNYQTVFAFRRTPQTAKKQQSLVKQQTKKGLFKKTSEMKKKEIINKITSQKAKDILKNCDFNIQSTFLDIHPLEAYQKMCGYLMIKVDPAILEYFKDFKCSESILFQNFHLIQMLTEIRNKLLLTEQIKLQVLERRKDVEISKDMIDSYISKWKQIVHLKTFESARNSFHEKEKFQWVLDNGFGQNLTKKDIINQRYRRFSYATFG